MKTLLMTYALLCSTNIIFNNSICNNIASKNFQNEPKYKTKDVLDSIITTIKSYNSKANCSIGKNEEFVNFFVYDLVDTANFKDASIISTDPKIIKFIEGHIYHFSYVYYEYSFSNILFLENGKIEIYKSINCTNSKDNIDSIIKILTPKFKKYENDSIVLRLKNFRKYGQYFGHDNYSYKLKCDCNPCD